VLEDKGLDYEEINLDDDPRFRQKLFDLTGGWTVPQIVIDGWPIGGYRALAARPRGAARPVSRLKSS
jgi:glutaredoxin